VVDQILAYTTGNSINVVNPEAVGKKSKVEMVGGRVLNISRLEVSGLTAGYLLNGSRTRLTSLHTGFLDFKPGGVLLSPSAGSGW
jgi:hypothetical protein